MNMKGLETITINKKKLIGIIGTAVSFVFAITFFCLAFYYDVGAIVIGNTAYSVPNSYHVGGLMRMYGELTLIQHGFLLILILLSCVSIISTAFFSRSFFKLSRRLCGRLGVTIMSCAVCMVFFICWLVYLPWFYDGPLDKTIDVLWHFRGMIIFVFARDILAAFLSVLLCRIFLKGKNISEDCL